MKLRAMNKVKCCRIKKKLSIVAAAVLLLLQAVPVHASNGEVDSSVKGSIRITLYDLEVEKSSCAGVEFSVWKTGTVDEHGKPHFAEAYGIKDYPQSGEELDKAAKKLAAQMKGEPMLKVKTDQNGTVLIRDVEAGVYLVTAAEKNPYGKIAPFLLHLPYWESTEGENGTFVYDVQVEPKASPYPEEKPETPKPDDPRPQEPSPEPPSNIPTGDTARPGFYLALLLLSITGIIIVSSKKYQGKKEAESDGRKK